jgi:hypothetical protein
MNGNGGSGSGSEKDIFTKVFSRSDSGKRFVRKFDEITKISIEPTQVLHSKGSLLTLSSKASKFSMDKHASLFSS